MRLRSRSIATGLVALACGLPIAWLARAAASPGAIRVHPPNPAAGQKAVLRVASPLAESAPAQGAWWDFGDGASSEAAAPIHVWPAAGEYSVRLQTDGETVETKVVVSPPDTLRLFRAHPFEISIEAVDSSLDARAGRAVAVDDRYGWFDFPDSD